MYIQISEITLKYYSSNHKSHPVIIEVGTNEPQVSLKLKNKATLVSIEYHTSMTEAINSMHRFNKITN